MKILEAYVLAPQASPREVGIEVEMEGEGMFIKGLDYWEIKGDGSLRGEAAEFVLTRPWSRKKVMSHIYRLPKS